MAEPGGASGERTLEQVKAEIIRRAGRSSPLEHINPEDAQAAVAALTSLDRDHWAEVWCAIGLRHEAEGDALLRKGADPVAIREAFFLAYANCRTGRYPVASTPGKVEAYQHSLRCFRKAARYFDPPLQVVGIPFEGKILTGDHSSLACISERKEGQAQLLCKAEGVLAGIELAEIVFKRVDSEIRFEKILEDGKKIKKGDIAFKVYGEVKSILRAERVVLNFMQRMSGIATHTSKFVEKVSGTNAKILDTRKTTPNFRYFEKWAVRIGGGHNHRFGLYDMIMLKDNHIDFCGGIEKAILSVKDYQKKNKLNLPMEIETRSISDVAEVLRVGGANRIMFDNFTPELMKQAVQMVNGKYETEASGGITLDTVSSFAETGVDFISVGALTHSSPSLDLSLKAL